ncbi:SMI1/KNR4 family protein [Nonomuraea dietziae]|uniref:SMI1/KNR4 family protein n=1 Tax=Nonomuraea dietziae TaxID=65515 RepID=UPI003410C5D7
MLKLLRMALTAAVLAAIAIRIDRRAPQDEEEVLEPVLGRPAPEDLERYRPREENRFFRGLLAGVVAGVLVGALGLVVATNLIGEPSAAAEYDRLVPQSEATVALVPEPTPTPAPTPAPTRDPACSPQKRRAVIRPLDSAVKREVDAEWLRVERWLKRHAPVTHAALRGPARARTIAVAEAQTGLRFPDDLRASLLRHDGSMAFGPGEASGLGVRGIRDTWRSLCHHFPTVEDPDPRLEYWNGRMIPFLHFPDRNSEHQEYALIDSQEGDVGWDDTIGGVDFGRAPSYLALLRANADALRDGGEVHGWRPRVVRGALRWERADG